MRLKFIDVVKVIEEGQVWVGTNKTIKLIGGEVVVNRTNEDRSICMICDGYYELVEGTINYNEIKDIGSLKTGMIVVFRNDVRGLVVGGTIKTVAQLDFYHSIIANLEDYDDNLTSPYSKEYDIMAVYEITCGLDYTVSELINGLPSGYVELKWQRDEIDWTKVKINTKVAVYDNEENKPEAARYFIGYADGCEKPIITVTSKKCGKIEFWKYGELIEEE